VGIKESNLQKGTISSKKSCHQGRGAEKPYSSLKGRSSNLLKTERPARTKKERENNRFEGRKSVFNEPGEDLETDEKQGEQ